MYGEEKDLKNENSITITTIAATATNFIVHHTTYLVDTAVNTAEGAAQRNVFLVHSVVTHDSFV